MNARQARALLELIADLYTLAQATSEVPPPPPEPATNGVAQREQARVE